MEIACLPFKGSKKGRAGMIMFPACPFAVYAVIVITAWVNMDASPLDVRCDNGQNP